MLLLFPIDSRTAEKNFFQKIITAMFFESNTQSRAGGGKKFNKNNIRANKS